MNAFLVSQPELAAIAPEIWLAVAATAILLLEAFFPALRRGVTFLALGAVAVASWLVAGLAPASGIFHGLVRTDALTGAWSQLVLLAVALSLLASRAYLEREGLRSGEYEALLLWAACGLLLLLRGAELLTIFVALELVSLCLYALAAFHRRLAWAGEAAIKYFLMGAFASSFVLYGIALLFGQTGSTRLAEIAGRAAQGVDSPGLFTLGLLLVVAGFGFKMSLAPFHAWAPDVYQGAPTPFVAFLSVAPKAASAFVLASLLGTVTGAAVGERWPALVAVLAVASMAVGNLFALVQRDIKRMLAYSGIAHMGYAVIPLVAMRDGTFWTPLFAYLLAYVFMNVGAFVVITLLYRRAGEQHSVADLSGWGYRYPFLAACLTVSMLSLAGLPPTAGFLGKYLVFMHAIEHGRLWLALVGIAASLVGVVYYLRVIYVLFMKPEQSEPEGLRIDWSGRLAAAVCALGSIVVGVWPQPVVRWILDAVRSLGG